MFIVRPHVNIYQMWTPWEEWFLINYVVPDKFLEAQNNNWSVQKAGNKALSNEEEGGLLRVKAIQYHTNIKTAGLSLFQFKQLCLSLLKNLCIKSSTPFLPRIFLFPTAPPPPFLSRHILYLLNSFPILLVHPVFHKGWEKPGLRTNINSKCQQEGIWGQERHRRTSVYQDRSPRSQTQDAWIILQLGKSQRER